MIKFIAHCTLHIARFILNFIQNYVNYAEFGAFGNKRITLGFFYILKNKFKYQIFSFVKKQS